MSDGCPFLPRPNIERATLRKRVTDVVRDVDQPLGVLLTRKYKEIVDRAAKKVNKIRRRGRDWWRVGHRCGSCVCITLDDVCW